LAYATEAPAACPKRGHFSPHHPKCRPTSHNLTQYKWLDAGALTEAEKALIEQRFRDLEADPHASVSWEEAKIRLKVPFRAKILMLIHTGGV
jgi:hypothetical protein